MTLRTKINEIGSLRDERFTGRAIRPFSKRIGLKNESHIIVIAVEIEVDNELKISFEI